MIYRTESPLKEYTRIQRRLQSGGIPYNFPMSINSEPIQGTDISTKPLGPVPNNGQRLL
jgi:hypothetical protein